MHDKIHLTDFIQEYSESKLEVTFLPKKQAAQLLKKYDENSDNLRTTTE